MLKIANLNGVFQNFSKDGVFFKNFRFQEKFNNTPSAGMAKVSDSRGVQLQGFGPESRGSMYKEINPVPEAARNRIQRGYFKICLRVFFRNATFSHPCPLSHPWFSVSYSLLVFDDRLVQITSGSTLALDFQYI